MVSLLSTVVILPSLATRISLSLATQAISPATRALRYLISRWLSLRNRSLYVHYGAGARCSR